MTKLNAHFLKRFDCAFLSIVLSVATPSAFAQEPTTRPAERQRPMMQLRERIAEQRMPKLAAAERQEPPSDAEWEDVSKFAKEHLPNRWKMFEEAQQNRRGNPKVIEDIKLRLANRYRILERARVEAPLVYEAAIKQAKLEDDIWARVRDLRKNPDDPALRNRVRDSVKLMVHNSLVERERRIGNMRSALEAEEKRLADDKANEDGLVEAQMDQMTAERPLANIQAPRPLPGPDGQRKLREPREENAAPR